MNLTDNNYTDVLENNVTVVDFWAPWCGPCKIVKPIFDKLETEDLGCVIAKCNVDENSEVSTKYGIRNLPTILFIKNGEVADKHVGVISETQLRQKISEFNS